MQIQFFFFLLCSAFTCLEGGLWLPVQPYHHLEQTPSLTPPSAKPWFQLIFSGLYYVVLYFLVYIVTEILFEFLLEVIKRAFNHKY